MIKILVVKKVAGVDVGGSGCSGGGTRKRNCVEIRKQNN